MSRLHAVQQDRLSSAELAALAESVQLFDAGQFRSSLRAAERVLARHPAHAEALAVQALGRAQFPSTAAQSISTARRATSANVRSVLCWHALAICYRKNQRFAEALKAYAQAARLDPTSFMMVREAALMSVMLHHHAPAIEFQLTALRMQPHVRTSWTQLAVSHHLAGSLVQAIRVLDAYQDVIQEQPAKSYEHSETLLYYATLLCEAKRYTDALEFLRAREAEMLDVNAREELAARCYMCLGQAAAAEKVFRFLLERNPHSAVYVQGYLLSKGIGSGKAASHDAALPILQDLEAWWPDSLAISAASLRRLSGSEFEQRVERQFVRACQKGVPSLFNSLKQYYDEADKREVIGAVAEKYRLAWQEAATTAAAATDNPVESPSAYLWSLYFLAQHYSYVGKNGLARAYIQSAIAHTPTLPELHMTKARILKRVGALRPAAAASETARLLDGQDRYVNCKAVEYALRIDDVGAAVDRAGRFTSKISDSPAADLIEQQAFWFMASEAAALLRRGEYAMALKRLTSIEETTDQLWHDQVDFHFWSVRKFNLRAYVSAMRYWDSVYSHPVAIQGALYLVDLCLRLYDCPELVDNQLAAAAADSGPRVGTIQAQMQTEMQTEASSAKLSANQKKRMKAKHKAEAAKKAADEAKYEDTEPKLPDPDPTGIEALRELDVLARAQQTCGYLQRSAADNVHTWLLTFAWAVRAENWLVAVRAAKQIQRLDPQHPDLHLAMLQLALHASFATAATAIGSAPGVVTALKDALASLIPCSASPESIHAQFLQRYSDLPEHTLAAARGLLLLSPPRRKDEPSARRDEIVELVLSLPQKAKAKQQTDAVSAAPKPTHPHEPADSCERAHDRSRINIEGQLSPYKDPTLISLVSGLDLLRDPKVAAPAAAVDEYLSAARQVWPDCDAFKTESMLQAEAHEQQKALQAWEAVTDHSLNGSARQVL